MDQIQCTNCGASLPATGTYCLACDTPVEGAVRGLSVSQPSVTQVGRPLLGFSIAAAVIIVVGLIAYGSYHLVTHGQNDKAIHAATRGVTLIVDAESGRLGFCKPVGKNVTGDPSATAAQCKAQLLGSDPGVKLKRLHMTHVDRHGSGATVRMQGTIIDAQGHRPFDRDIKVAKVNGTWLMVWDGKPLT